MPLLFYPQIDHFYGPHALAVKDGFTGAQGTTVIFSDGNIKLIILYVATMNVIETFLNILYLYLLRQENITVGQCNLVGFSGALMTLSKTILYWLIEPFSEYQHIGHNSIKNLVFLWIVKLYVTEFKASDLIFFFRSLMAFGLLYLV